MNSAEMLRGMGLSWSQLVALTDLHSSVGDEFKHMDVHHTQRTSQPWPAVYDQSSISAIVDEHYHIRTKGCCYTKPCWEVKLPIIK